MKITFLGTSHGVPEADRYCSCTLISAGGQKYLVDAGGPVMDMLIRSGIDPADISAVFVTHMHGDHTNGLPAFTDLISWYFKTAVPSIYLPDPRGIDALRLWNTVIHGRSPADYAYEEGIIFNDGTLRVGDKGRTPNNLCLCPWRRTGWFSPATLPDKVFPRSRPAVTP